MQDQEGKQILNNYDNFHGGFDGELGRGGYLDVSGDP